MSKPPLILGAGLAGLIAAHAWPQMQVVEATSAPRAGHRALLRFRSDGVAKLTGIEFREVTVRKGIWSGGAFRPPDIGLANHYSRKVLGEVFGERSIWNTDAVRRWIAPEDFYEQMCAAVGDRIAWGSALNFQDLRGPVISTAPLPDALRALDAPPQIDFHRAAILVHRWRLRKLGGVYQTVYFPDPNIHLYRASITDNLLIAEFAGSMPSNPAQLWPLVRGSFEQLYEAFGLQPDEMDELDKIEQKFGKIKPIDDAARKHAMHRLTAERRIFSLGRFATWRNILLDDVVDDIAVIKRLLRASEYDLLRAAL